MKANVSTQREFDPRSQSWVDVIVVTFGATRITLKGNNRDEISMARIEGDDEQQTLDGSLHEVWPWLVDEVKNG